MSILCSQCLTIFQRLVRRYGYLYFFYYLQVYSHETGRIKDTERIKIKLCETARPKTPIMVTRTRSNAGDNKYENQVIQ